MIDVGSHEDAQSRLEFEDEDEGGEHFELSSKFIVAVLKDNLFCTLYFALSDEIIEDDDEDGETVRAAAFYLRTEEERFFKFRRNLSIRVDLNKLECHTPASPNNRSNDSFTSISFSELCVDKFGEDFIRLPLAKRVRQDESDPLVLSDSPLLESRKRRSDDVVLKVEAKKRKCNLEHDRFDSDVSHCGIDDNLIGHTIDFNYRIILCPCCRAILRIVRIP